jgi:ATP-binding cassette, subfamily G (WHITE), member 2, PDR
MLDIVGKKSKFDWPETWKNSQEFKEVLAELDRIHNEKRDQQMTEQGHSGEFAMPLTSQIYYVAVRVFQQYWRTPTYIYGKFSLGVMSALFIGFSFYKQNSTATGLQNTLFSIFMLTSIFSTLVQQVGPTRLGHCRHTWC